MNQHNAQSGDIWKSTFDSLSGIFYAYYLIHEKIPDTVATDSYVATHLETGETREITIRDWETSLGKAFWQKQS